MSDSNRGGKDTPIDKGVGLVLATVLCCLIVGLLAFSWGRDSERDEQRAAEYQEYSERRERAFCNGLTDAMLAQCQMEQEQAAREAYQSDRNLNAQRDMALWALAVFVISAVTAGLTLWALFYVRETLLATQEAVNDTSETTKAMVRQNELTFNVQRPRISISCEPVWLEKSSAGISYAVRVGFKNTGMIIAESFFSKVITEILSGEERSFVKSKWDIIRANRSIYKGGLLPGEILPAPAEHHSRIGLSGYTVMVVAAAHYRIGGSEEWHSTERSYMVYLRKESDFEGGFFNDKVADGRYRADELHTRLYLSGETS